MMERFATRTAGFLAGLLLVAVVVTAEQNEPSEVSHAGSSLTETVVSAVSGTTIARAADQEACPCWHQILCCFEWLREWWFEHGDWPGANDQDEGGDADEVIIRTNPNVEGDPTELEI